jgi:hypothetical protein
MTNNTEFSLTMKILLEEGDVDMKIIFIYIYIFVKENKMHVRNTCPESE